MACCFIQLSVFAQDSKPNTSPSIITLLDVPSGDVFFYGIDFSVVKIYGADETNYDFEKAFARINEILVREPKKFDFGKLLNRDVINYPIPAQERNTYISWNNIRTIETSFQKVSIEDIVRSYKLPHQNGKGIVLIAWLLNKPEGIAEYEFVVFDIQTRKILFNIETLGNAGGAGLRNYWANSIYNIIKNKKLKKKVMQFF